MEPGACSTKEREGERPAASAIGPATGKRPLKEQADGRDHPDGQQQHARVDAGRHDLGRVLAPGGRPAEQAGVPLEQQQRPAAQEAGADE